MICCNATIIGITSVSGNNHACTSCFSDGHVDHEYVDNDQKCALFRVGTDCNRIYDRDI